MITRSISNNVKLIEDTETLIRLEVRKGYFSNSAKVMEKVDKLIEDCVEQLPKGMQANTRKSLKLFARRLMALLRVSFGVNGLLVWSALQKANKGKLTAAEYKALQLPTKNKAKPTFRLPQKAENTKLPDWLIEDDAVEESNYSTMSKGVANSTYSKNYIKAVNKVMQEMADTQSLDANDIIGRNSLRNYAEMYERHAFHEKQLAEFKDKGVNLVICSVHADCSLRCFKHQGKVYSLDGTSGRTADGRAYVPLETATDQNQVYYTNPRTGTAYKGGLLGYNCRHKLYEFTGQKPPRVSKEEQKRESEINRKQREYENQIRKWRERALTCVDEKERKKAKQKATALYKEYVAFSIAHERAYYPDRCKVLFND